MDAGKQINEVVVISDTPLLHPATCDVPKAAFALSLALLDDKR